VKNGTTAAYGVISNLDEKAREYFQVLEGLQPGEQVITSSYENFSDVDSMDVLEIKRLHRI
jgi:HlyD family secretion protein